MKKSKVMAAAVALTVAGIMSASAQMLVYDFKMDVRNPEATTFTGGTAPYQKLVDTAFTAKNTFTGYIITEVCCGDPEGQYQDIVMLITRKGDTSKKFYLFDPVGINSEFEDVGNHCPSAWAYMAVGVYEKGVGGPNDPADCRYPINVAKIKTAQVEMFFGEDNFLPGLFFGAAGLRFTYGTEQLPFPRYYMPETYGYSTSVGDVEAMGFGTIKPVGSTIGCEPTLGYCAYLDKADGVILGWFGINTKCGDDVIWTLCSLGVVQTVLCGYTPLDVYAPVAFDDGGDQGLFAGTWSMKINATFTKLQDWDLIWTAIMVKNQLLTTNILGAYIYNRARFVETLCPPAPEP